MNHSSRLALIGNTLLTPSQLSILFFCTLWSTIAFGQVPWVEDFAGYPDQTMTSGMWTSMANDCDDGALNTGGNWWGVVDALDEFRCNDIEGFNCNGPGGDNQNTLTTAFIDISAVECVTATINYRAVGNFECDFPAGPTDDPVGFYDSHDQMVFEYSLDGGPWTMFATNGYYCETTTVNISDVATQTNLMGNSLRLRVVMGNQANNENFYISNIEVVSSSTQPNLTALPPLCDNGNPLTLNPNQDGFAGTWSGPGVTGNMFNPSIGANTYTLTFTPNTGQCADPNTTDVTVNASPTANPAGPLEVCDNGSGQATFDLTTLDATIGGGSTVLWFQDMALGTQIMTPGSYTTGSTTVYAIVEVPPCISSPQAITLTVSPVLSVANLMTTCSGDNSTYTVTFDLNGGATPYMVSGGGVVTGSTFTSNPIPSGTAYSFTVSDASGCTPIVENGTFSCCMTSAGTMDLTPINLCTDQAAMGIHNGDQVLDGDDIFGYVLHTGTLNDVTDIVSFSLGAPNFNFNNITMTPGVTYFLSAVAGNTGTPIIDFNDLCIDISPGTPITWFAPPNLNSPGNQNVCNRYTLPVITGSNLSGNEGYFTATNGGGTQLAVGSDVTTTMTIFIYDETIANCSDEVSFTVTIVPPPDISPLADQTACSSYTLPMITGSNLTGAEAFFTGPNGTGTQFNSGQNITMSMTLFIFDGTPGCSDEESFMITITPQPDINPIGDQVACNSYTLPVITGTNLTGAEAYYTGPNGSGTPFTAGTNITMTTTLFIYDGTAPCDDEETFTVTITPTPDIDPIANQTTCNAFPLPNITGTNLTGNQAYYTGPGGTGTQFLPGQNITTTTTLFIYDGSPGCDDEETFTITITPQPDINPIANQTACNGFTLPNITGTNLSGFQAYYTGPNGTGTPFLPGAVITNSITLFIFDGTPPCTDEESFTITINNTPDIFALTDQSACGGFTLPVINGTDLSGAEAYYTGPNATGTQFTAGQIITNSVTLFIYDGLPGCDDEESFNITITQQPDIFPVADESACGGFTLPAINGTNLSGNQAYYTGTNATGTQFLPGTVITTTTTLFIFDGVTGCSDEESFTITINLGPDITPIADADACDSFTLPVIQGTDLSGNEAYYTGSGGTGTQFLPGTVVNTTTSLFIYDGVTGCNDEETFNITINATPQLQQPADVNACGDFTLPAIQGTNLTGNEAYFTGPNGTGTQFLPGEIISANTSLFIYDVNSGCDAEVSFNITISAGPDIDPIADQMACGFYILPAITGTNLSGNEAYYSESGGMGNVFNPGDFIIANASLFIYDGSVDCFDEEIINITINEPPILNLTEAIPINCNGDTNGSLNLEITGNGDFDIDWNVDALDGNAMPQELGAGVYQVIVTDVNNCTAEANFILTEPDALTINCAELNPVTTVGGNDGEASINLTGGTAPYMVSWTGPVNGNSTQNTPGDFTISDLEAGNYQIDIVDANNCPTTCTFTITDPNCALTVDIESTDITCNGDGDGTITLTINNAADPFTIDWNDDTLDGDDNPQNLEQGNYTVVITDNNACSATASTTINEPSPVFLNCSVLNNTSGPGVNDGQIELDFGGGIAPLTIEWTGAVNTTQVEPAAGNFIVSDLPAGDYVLTITDENGCMETCGFTITSPDCLTTLDIEGQNLSCNDSGDGSITLTINDGPADPTIDWNFDQYDGMDQLSDLDAGDYTVIVSDGLGCEVTTSIMITEPDALMLDCAELNPVSSVGAMDGEATITFSGGTAPYSIEWTGNQDDNQEDAPGTISINNLEAGSYVVVITDQNECSTDCNFIITDPNCTLTADIMSEDISCRGSSDGSIDLNLSGGNGQLTIDWNDDNLDGMENVSGLDEGDYDVVVTDELGCEITASITLEATNELPEASISVGGLTCSEDCYSFNINLTGVAPFTVNYQMEIGGNIQNLTLNTNDNNNVLEFCPEDLGVSSGPISIIFEDLEDANCLTELNQNEIITVVETPTETLNPTLCDGGSITVNGTVYDAATPQGMEVVQGAGPAGCDSVYIIDLSFFDAIETDITDQLCSGESITVNGNIYDEDNDTGQEVLVSSNGCDSTVNIALSFFDTPVTDLSPTLCPGESILVNGNTYDVDMPIGQEILSTVDGCDSTVNIALAFFQPVETDLIQTLCEGGSITVNGTVYDETTPSGQEIFIGETVNGCDSIVNIDLSFSTSVVEDINLELCGGESLIVNGNTYDEDMPMGQEIIPNGSIFGCDSIINVDLSFYISIPTEISGDYCNGESLIINGMEYNENNPSGTEIITLPNGCDSTILVDLNFVDEVTSIVNPTLCENESIEVNGITYDIDNSSGSQTIPGGSVSGCDSTIMVDLIFEPAIVAEISGGGQICPGESVTLTINLSEPGEYTVRYSDGLNGIILNDIEDGYTFEVTPTQSTNYFLDLVVIPNSNCPATIIGQAEVEVSNLSLSLEVSDYSGFGVSCNGSNDGSINLNASGGLLPINYDWSNGESSASLNSLEAGTYSVIVTDAAGCSLDATATITEPEGIILESSIKEPDCFDTADGNITIESISGGTAPFEYSLDGEFFQSIDTPPFSINNLNGGLYSVFVQDANDCQTELEFLIPTPQQLLVDLGEDVEIKLGDSIALDPFVNFQPESIVWTPTDDLSDPSNLKTFASPFETTEYQIEVTDANGCVASDAITITVDNFLIVYAPNAFSPNGDGVNDRFTLFGDASVLQIDELIIFDRWGNKVYDATELAINDQSLGWDGKFLGKIMNVGVYVYYAKVSFVNGRTEVFKGDVNLLK